MEDKYFSSILTAVSRMNSQAQSPRLSPIQHYNRSVHQQYGMNHKPSRPSPLVLTSEPSRPESEFKNQSFDKKEDHVQNHDVKPQRACKGKKYREMVAEGGIRKERKVRFC